MSHNYKYLEGLLNWYFGSQVELSYRLISNEPALTSPSVIINGKIFSRGEIKADEIVKYLENLGLIRIDN